jgi:hypothetical protein
MPSTGRPIQLHNCMKHARCGCVVISDGIHKYCEKCVERQGELTEVLLSEDRCAILERSGNRERMW